MQPRPVIARALLTGLVAGFLTELSTAAAFTLTWHFLYGLWLPAEAWIQAIAFGVSGGLILGVAEALTRRRGLGWAALGAVVLFPLIPLSGAYFVFLSELPDPLIALAKTQEHVEQVLITWPVVVQLLVGALVLHLPLLAVRRGHPGWTREVGSMLAGALGLGVLAMIPWPYPELHLETLPWGLYLLLIGSRVVGLPSWLVLADRLARVALGWLGQATPAEPRPQVTGVAPRRRQELLPVMRIGAAALFSSLFAVGLIRASADRESSAHLVWLEWRTLSGGAQQLFELGERLDPFFVRDEQGRVPTRYFSTARAWLPASVPWDCATVPWVVRIDVARAARCYRRASDLGHAEASYRLFRLLLYEPSDTIALRELRGGDVDGWSSRQVIELLARGAEGGWPPAMADYGVQLIRAGYEEQGLRWLRRSARRCREGKFELGVWLRRQGNTARGWALIETAAEQGSLDAQLELSSKP